jgi:hypothetical protein
MLVNFILFLIPSGYILSHLSITTINFFIIFDELSIQFV